MFVPRRVIARASLLAKNCKCILGEVTAPAIRELCPTNLQRDKHSRSSDSEPKYEIPGLMAPRYEPFDEKTAPIILDIEEERQKIVPEEEVRDEFEGLNLERGKTGVFEIDEVVDILRSEKAQDMCVIKVPSELTYVDYMVIVNGRSARHMLSMMQFIRKVYKKKMFHSDIIPLIEGANSKTWMALDLGNIIVHVFSKEGRDMYDLDSLWSLGKDYDSLSHGRNVSLNDMMTDYAKVLSGLTPELPDR